MLVCPVCKYSHQEEVENCQRCSWLMQNDPEIDPKHPLLTTCISMLTKKLEEESASKKKLQTIIQQLELQKLDSHKLDEILDELEQDRKQNYKQFENLNKIISGLKSSLLEANQNSPDIALEVKGKESFQQHDDLGKQDSKENSNRPHNSINSDQINDPHNQPSDRKSSETNNDRENYEPDNNHNSSYQSFYGLIQCGELEVTKVSIPQETLEKARSITQSELKFVEDKKGNYWIVDWQGVYCLIPKENNIINQHQYGNFQRVFNCLDYQELYTDFEIVKPATVINRDGDNWRLETKGKIKFI